jgi:isopenicillin-N epimerase
MRNAFSALWPLDPTAHYLNHGSFGACPTSVLRAQAALRDELERDPVDFLAVRLPERLLRARTALAAFLGADPADLAFVPNATSGVNTVLRSLEFRQGDEILVTTHGYAACRNAAEYVAARTGARLVVAALPFPLAEPRELIEPVLAAVTPRTRLAVLDHVTSPTALVLPVAELVRALDARGVDTLVDGAHAPGMVPLDLGALGAAYYTGNAHKWLCAPKGAAFLHVRRDRQDGLRPLVISHGYGAGFQAEFDWTGTVDPTPWLCIPEAIEYVGGLLPGGWREVMARNHALAVAARAVVLESLALAPPCPASLLGSIASIALPEPRPGSAAASLAPPALGEWFRARGIRTWLHHHPLRVLRVSAQLYNSIDEYRLLARLLGEALGAG